MSKSSHVGASLTLALNALLFGCNAEPEGPDRVVAADATVQLLSRDSQEESTPSGLSIKLIATVEAPTVGSTKLQANSFWLESNLAYVAYNNAGLPIAGAIDVIDLKVPATPRLVSELKFPSQKINGLTVSQGSLYYTGSSSELGGAVVGKVALSGNGALGAATAPTRIASYAGTSIVAHGDALYATSGDTGGLTLLDSKLSVGRTVSLGDARGVTVSADGKTVAVVRGQPGAVELFDAAGTKLAAHSVGGASIPESKSTIQMGSRLAVTSLGDGGFAVLCAQNGKVLATQSALQLDGTPAGGTVTNAVTAGSGLVFAANGLAGVYVYQLTQGALSDGSNCPEQKLTELGFLDLGDFSANMVYFRDGYLFMADGLGGFRVLTVQNAMLEEQREVDFSSPGTGLVVLNSSADRALNLSGNASIEVKEGYVYVNSSSSKARSATGNSKLIVKASFVVGGDSVSGNASLGGAVTTGASALPDPFSWLPVPSSAGVNVEASGELSVSDNTTRTLRPGVYQKGIKLSGNAKVTLEPGVYYIAEGGLSVSGNAILTGTGVMIYNASTRSGIDLSGNGNVKLTPPSSGTYAGITLYQNRSSSAPVSLSGNGELNIRGTIYAARAPLTLSSNAKLPTLGSLDVADTITVSGNASMVVSQ